MRKYLLIGAGVVVLGLAIAFGPTAIDLIRLQNYVESSAKVADSDAGPWPRTIDSCALCHGRQGRSVNSRYPSLAGLSADYLEAQLRAFAKGQRHNPNMGPLAMELTDTDIAALGAYYAKQAPQPNPFAPRSGAVVTQGKRLAEAGNCAACHGPNMVGQEAIPRLAGQGSVYLARQLDAFADGSRTESSGTMNMLAAQRTPAERKAIAQYLASLDPDRK